MNYEITLIGLLISLLFIGFTGIYPGGIIVPSYLALFAEHPARIGGTWIAALLALLCYRFASRYLILFGRRRFIFIIFLGAIWTYFGYRFLPFLIPASQEFRVIGWIIPGLIANQFEKQGMMITTASMVTVTVMIYVLGRLLQGVL